jgi:penicillin-binding protein 2
MRAYNQSRSRIIQLIFIAVFVLIIGQLVNLQLFGDFESMAFNNAVYKKVVYPSRGIIYDRKGKAILDNVAMFDLTVTPFQVKNLDTAMLCQIVGIDTAEFRKRLVTAILKNGRYRPSVFEGLVSPQLQAQLEENMYRFSGFDLTERPIRSYPFKAAAHILGYVGEVDSTIIKQSNFFYQMGDYAGRAGLEKTYEPILMGQRGIKYLIKDNKNRIQGSYEDGAFDTAAIAGRNLYSSIDIELQELAEKLLNGKFGSAVAINPRTGGILAMASAPGYDPNLLTGPERRKNFSRMFLDTAKPLLNRAIKGQYPPGSTFKPLGALVALDEGLITPRTGYPCGGAYYSCGRPVRCTHAGGGHAANLRLSIANSCNAYYTHVFREAVDNKAYPNAQAGYLKWKEYMNAFGLGVRLKVDLPSEDKGNIPDTSRYNKDFGGFAKWNSCNILTLGIGQDRMLATPLQLANSMCIIANKGYYYVPHFVDSVENEGVGDTAFLAKYRQKHVPLKIHDTLYDAVILGMHDVTIYGTATRAKFPGVNVCAKTGTAENYTVINGKTVKQKNHSLFVAFAPMEDPKIAVAVVVENSGYGATWAGPIASLMMEKYLHDTIATDRLAELERVSKADLIPDAIKRWYRTRDSLRQARERQVDENELQNLPRIEKKTTYDPEAEPNRKDPLDSANRNQQPMIKPDETRLKRD